MIEFIVVLFAVVVVPAVSGYIRGMHDIDPNTQRGTPVKANQLDRSKASVCESKLQRGMEYYK
jgi:hypothetical protein